MSEELLGNIKGPKGDKGDTGAQGPQGVQGDYPTFRVDSDGNLYVTYPS